MKNDFEMYQSVLFKRNEYRLRKERRIRIIKRTVPILACFVFTVVLVLGWKHADKMPIIPSDPDIIEVTTEAITSAGKGNAATVTTVPITTQVSTTQKTTSVSVTTSISASYAVTEAQSHTVTSMVSQPITAKIQTTSAIPAIVTTTSSVTAQTSSEGGNAGFVYTTTSSNDEDMAFVHTTTNNSESGFVHTTIQTSTTEPFTTSTVTTTTVPLLPINENYSFGIIDGYDGWYINTFKIPSDYVDEYIGIIVMRSASAPFLDAKAYKIKNVGDNVAIAVKFEEDDRYYLYRSNKTSISVIKDLFPDEGSNLKERTIFYE